MRSHPRLVAGSTVLALSVSLVAVALAQSSDLPAGERLRTGREVRELLASRAKHLSVSAGVDPDTVYVGKSFTNHVAPDNYWNLYAGTYRPGTNNPTNALWDWDNSVGLQAPDSLQGWWPYSRQYNLTGGLTLTDDQRPWWCIDYGNMGNYAIPTGSAAKRTFGVVGYWHDDPGVNAGRAVMWTPLSGNRSAWCGLRQQGDLTVKDQVTGNYYSGDAVTLYAEGTSSSQGSARLPGYLDQMDQLLYRDIAVAPGQALTVSFLYRTRMSTSIVTTASTRSGWFHGDPLAVTAGNFISSSFAGANAPQDSFMVYVGAPVNDAACVYSDGVTRPVYDPQRRWFSEVIKLFGGASYYEIFAATGANPPDTLAATPTPSASVTVPAAAINNVLAQSPAGLVRLVFRCKTNRGYSDGTGGLYGYSSSGRGAVVIDDVRIDRGAGPELIGDFETPQQGGVNAIDNRFPLPPGLATTDVWRSTGKPLPVYMHVEGLSGLTYQDLCGPPDSPARHCNLAGAVLVTGNHDQGEAFGNADFAAFREARTYAASPTINLLDGPGGGVNSMGMRQSIAHATDDIYLWYDAYWGYPTLAFSGMSWSFGNQAYPVTQPNGGKCWSDRQYTYFQLFNDEPECFTDYEPFAGDAVPIVTSNLSGIPDSLRVLIGTESECFRFAVSLGCNSTAGMYFDNVSVAFVDIPGAPGQASASSTVSLGSLNSDIWQFVNDTFPANETAGLPGTSSFDTTTAFIRTGLNIAQFTNNLLRLDIPGDSSCVTAANATVGTGDDPALKNVRVDMVFRILPGPGNYRIAGGRLMVPGGNAVSGVLLQTPTNQAAAAVAGDPSFWGQYMADPGLVSRGAHTGPGGWDPLTWNSCRMDTLELNIFPTGAPVFTGTGLSPGKYQTTIHESDPKFATLGVNKFVCFVIDTTNVASSSPSLNNVACDGTVPAWLNTVPRARTGWNGSNVTKEFTPIIPDGLLTPGSHVQYFFRKSHASDPNLEYAMCPDTNFITPQNREGSTDEHRWQQFSVLPDRWKNSAFGGAGSACMLYVDWDDRRGNEGLFVSIMDTLSGTAPAKYGAHNGWHAPGNVNINGLDVRTNMSVVVSNKNSQPGTTWDMYGVKAAESFTTNAGQLGSRLANRSSMGFAAGRYSRQGPTPEMLRAYYRLVTILTGGLNAGIFGPYINRSQNDIALLNDFLSAAGGLPQPRGLLIQGDGFGQSEKATSGIDPSHLTFMTDKLGVVFRSGSYQSLSGNVNDCADLLTTTALTSSAGVYGVVNQCSFSNDVYNRNPGLAEAVEGSFYENVGLNGPYVADVVKPAVALRNWVSVTSGYDLAHLFSRYCDIGTYCSNSGRQAWYYYMLNHVFASLCQVTGPATPCLDVPGSSCTGLANFMKIGDALMRNGISTVRLGIALQGRVRVCIYDVAGRRVRTLADRVFPAGEQELRWDGTDDAGGKVGRGVYFVRSSNDTGTGRIVVLDR